MSSLSDHNLLNLDPVYLKSVSSWLSFEPNQGELIDFLANNDLYQERIPLSRQSLEIVGAYLRTEMQAAKDSGPGKGNDALVITSQLIQKLPHYGLAVLAVIDALQPSGVVPLVYLDNREKETDLGERKRNLEGSGKTLLGTLIGFTSVGSGPVAARVKVKVADEEVIQIDVPPGELILVPLGDKPTELDVCCQGALLEGRKKAVVDAVGGEIGIILDSRGRPIKFPQDQKDRRDQIKRWLEVFL